MKAPWDLYVLFWDSVGRSGVPRSLQKTNQNIYVNQWPFCYHCSLELVLGPLAVYLCIFWTTQRRPTCIFQNLIQLLIRCVTNLGLVWGPKQSPRVIKIGSNREHQIWSIIAKVLGQVRIWLGMYTEQVTPDLTLGTCTFTQQHVCT